MIDVAPLRATLFVSSAACGFDGGTLSGDAVATVGLHTGHTAIIVVDVAGHGTARAGLSSALADAITRALCNDGSPAAALDRADDLLRTSGDALPYAIAFVALVHPLHRTVVYASAGHDVAFILADDGHSRFLAPTAPMLGIPLANHACDAVFTLGSRESLVVVTDGVSDSRPAGSAQFFGAAGTACAVAQALRDGSDPARSVLRAARVHEGGCQADDVGAAVVRFRGYREP